jgi:hypothetical protein
LSDALKLIDQLTGYNLGNAAPSAREIVDELAAAGYVIVPASEIDMLRAAEKLRQEHPAGVRITENILVHTPNAKVEPIDETVPSVDAKMVCKCGCELFAIGVERLPDKNEIRCFQCNDCDRIYGPTLSAWPRRQG